MQPQYHKLFRERVFPLNEPFFFLKQLIILIFFKNNYVFLNMRVILKIFGLVSHSSSRLSGRWTVNELPLPT